MIASMKIAAYTGASGRDDQACMSSMTLSVIRETVSLPTDAPYTSAKCAEISPVVNPRA
jgi:L-cysteine desulfidase